MQPLHESCFPMNPKNCIYKHLYGDQRHVHQNMVEKCGQTVPVFLILQRPSQQSWSGKMTPDGLWVSITA